MSDTGKNMKPGIIAGRILLLLAVTIVFTLSPSIAATGNVENGGKLYAKKCWWCHGKEGEADGPGAEFMMPPPRDFSEGVYKFKTADPTAEIVRDEDLFRAIKEGMPGSAMPSWKEIFKDPEIWDLVAFVKSLTDMFEDMDNPAEISYAGKIPSSPESIEKGRKAFEAAKCFECHGQAGKGDTTKKLKEDSGAKLWPRNLTKPWTFRSSYTAEAIFARVSNGIPSTPMPSFAGEKTEKGKLSLEDRWHVVNYVMSLKDDSSKTKDGDIVIRGIQMAELPKDENDPAWDKASATAFFLVPQIIEKERFFTPTNNLVKVSALFNDSELAFLVEWDDRSKSVPGNDAAAAIAWGDLTPDALAIQTPVVLPTASEKPYFGHGDASHPVSMMYWNSGSVESPNSTMLLTTTGTGNREKSDATAAGFSATGSYKDGTWRVMMKRKLTANVDMDTSFEAGRYIPIAFANWDGSNGEVGSKHTLTSWYWLLLKPETGSAVVVLPSLAFLLLVGGQLLFAGFLSRSRQSNKS